MPPNRKAHTEIARNIASLKLSYALPASKAPEVSEQPSDPPIDSASYWEWPADDEPNNNKKDVDITANDDVFSANHIVANLVQAAAQMVAENQTVKQHHAVTMDSSADYWFQPFKRVDLEPVENELFSVQHLENNLIQQAEGAVFCHRHEDPVLITVVQEENAPYWNWPAWPEKEAEEPFAVNRFEANLVKDQQRLQPAAAAVVHTGRPSDDYWAF